MQKVMAVCALALLPAFWYPAWGQPESVGINGGKEVKPENAAAGDKSTHPRGTKENPFIVDTTGHQQTPIEREETKQQAAEAQKDKYFHDGIDIANRNWAATTAIATAGLILVGIGGVCAAIKTLRSIVQQTAATQASVAAIRDQIDIMKAPYVSWVKFQGWEVLCSAQSDRNIRISCQIYNDCDFPITITAMGMDFFQVTDVATLLLAKHDVFVPPKSAWRFSYWIPISDVHMNRLYANTLTIRARSVVMHHGPLGRDHSQRQELEGFLKCWRDGTFRAEFLAETNSGPKDHADPDSPN